MKVVRKLLSEEEGLPPNLRYSEDCDCVEITFDGGETWVEREEFDPRYGSGYRAPPLDTSDPRCDAAAGMVFAIEDTVNVTLGAASIIDAANAFFGLITVFNPGFGIIMKILILLAEFLFAIGTAALTLAFDNDAYAALTCIFYDEIGEDGQMSAAQLEAINTRVCAEMDVTVCAVVGFLLNTYGEVTFSNAGALAGLTGDCTDCDEYWCYEWTSFGDWTQDSTGQGSVSSILMRTFPISTVLTHAEFEWSYTGSAEGAVAAWVGNSYGLPRIMYSSSPTTLSALGVSWDGSEASSGFTFGGNGVTDSGTTVTMTRLLLRGIGENPFGSDNCE